MKYHPPRNIEELIVDTLKATLAETKRADRRMLNARLAAVGVQLQPRDLNLVLNRHPEFFAPPSRRSLEPGPSAGQTSARKLMEDGWSLSWESCGSLSGRRWIVEATREDGRRCEVASARLEHAFDELEKVCSAWADRAEVA
jgi:hypothetical protein